MVTEIDPIEAVIELARTDTTLIAEVSTQIDVWHRYGQDSGDWPLNSKSLVFVPSGGEQDRHNPWARPVFAVRCYGDSPFDCGQVWKALNDFTFNQPRRNVTTGDGKALISYVLPVPGGGMPTLLFDEDVRPNGGMPFYQVEIVAEVSNVIVT